MNLVLKYVYKKIPAWHIPHAISFKDALAQGKLQNLTKVPLTNQDVAFLQYTGGTTGISKGAVLTHRNIIANIQQADAWFKNLVTEGNEVIITALPLYHIFSLTANCLYFSKVGGLNVLITNPRDIPNMIKEVKKFKFTTITGVNTLFNGLLKNPQFAKLDFSALKLTLGGGMAVQRAVAENWQKVTGVPLIEAYGLTETSPCVTINPANLTAYNGSIGLPVSSTDVCVLDDVVKSAYWPSWQLAEGAASDAGLLAKPKGNGQGVHPVGGLLTGDIGTMDQQGYVRILAQKDMIWVPGLMFANEIECACAYAGYSQAAVIGIPDEHSARQSFIVKKMKPLPWHMSRPCRDA